jgi:hypothetical protein
LEGNSDLVHYERVHTAREREREEKYGSETPRLGPLLLAVKGG